MSSYFKDKMHQLWLGLHLGPRSGSLQRSPDPVAGFKGPTSKGKEGRARKGPIERGSGGWSGST